MDDCTRCGESPTILSVPEAGWSFCSLECLTKYSQTREENIKGAEQMFGGDLSRFFE